MELSSCSRKEFIGALASSVAIGGCRSVSGCSSFYGPTVRDRLWMWGHHADCASRAAACARLKGVDFKWPGRTVDQAEG